MTPAELKTWFKELLAQQPRPAGVDLASATYDVKQMAAWVAEAHCALEAVFPAGHAILKRWNAALSSVNQGHSYALGNYAVAESAMATFAAAASVLESDRVGSLVATIRAETLSEIIDQAEHLADKGYRVAATVTASGALEVHLKHLCEQSDIDVPPPGSIGKYNDAISRARNDGKEVYSATEGKQVGAWGGHRNDASHDPVAFDPAVDQVRLMVDGIRQFLLRTARSRFGV